MNAIHRCVLFLFVFAVCPLTVRGEPQSAESAAGSPAEKQNTEDVPYEDIQVFARALQLIRQDYVNGKKAGYRTLIYSALRGMLSELDPHSQFMEPKDFKGMQEDTRSEFGGLGVMVEMKNGVLTVITPMEGTPGFQAGILPGDQILKINGTSTERMTVPEAVEMLRGEPGQKVSLTIVRPSTREIKDYDMTRVVIKVPSVKAAQILPLDETDGRKIGYVRITQFNEPTAAELGRELDKLEKKGMQGLILDLRYNPGGLLTSAVDVCGQFLPPNTKVVYTEGRTPAVQREYRTAHNSGKRRAYPVVVLINYASASGSEIVAGALKDLKRAVLVGETSFGKGSVQSVVSLPDGSAMRFTTAKYYTPARQLIHEHGVSPNIRVPMTYQQGVELQNSWRKAEASSKKDQIVDVADDIQLDRAVDSLAGALIYEDRNRTEMAKKNP